MLTSACEELAKDDFDKDDDKEDNEEDDEEGED